MENTDKFDELMPTYQQPLAAHENADDDGLSEALKKVEEFERKEQKELRRLERKAKAQQRKAEALPLSKTTATSATAPKGSSVTSGAIACASTSSAPSNFTTFSCSVTARDTQPEKIDAGFDFFNHQFDGNYPGESDSFRDTLIRHAKEAGLTAAVALSWNMDKEVEFTEATQNYSSSGFSLYRTVGTGPGFAFLGVDKFNKKQPKPGFFERMKEAAQDSDVVAIGPTGLDYTKRTESDDQEFCFREQIRIAAQVKKPLYIVSNGEGANMRVIEMLRVATKKYPNITGVIHCFNGHAEDSTNFVNLGFHIGITGLVTQKGRNTDLVQAICTLPLDKVIVQTNSPFNIPFEYKRKWNATLNQPDSMYCITEMLADIYGSSHEEVSAVTTDNAKNLFNI